MANGYSYARHKVDKIVSKSPEIKNLEQNEKVIQLFVFASMLYIKKTLVVQYPLQCLHTV